MLNSEAFKLVRNILSESRGLSLIYLETLDENIEAIDMGIRSKMENSERLYDQIRRHVRDLAFGEILFVQDPLLLNSVTFRCGPGENGFYCIGPFRSRPYEEEDYTNIRSKNGLTYSNLEYLRPFLQAVPCNIMRTEATAVAKNILLSAHGVADPVVREMDLVKAARDAIAIAPIEDINTRAKRVEEVYRHEKLLMSYIAEGNEDKACEEGMYFMRTNMDQRLSNRFLSQRSLLYSANTEFRNAARTKGIHPYYLDEISRKFAKKLELCTTHDQLNDIYFEMICAYCRFCREHTIGHYSSVIQKIVNYIQLNLSEDLTPEIIAEAVNFSTSYLSKKFKGETGMSLKTFITDQRVRVAKKLLKETDMTVKEISVYVGVSDWNYFTKLFRKVTGDTPTDYRKKHGSAT